MQVERYRIVLTGWVLTGFRTEDVAVELGKLFKIRKQRVWPLLAGEPSIIRRNLTLEKAQRLQNKIERRGAVCVLKKVLQEESECILSDHENTGILEPDLNMDLTKMLSNEELLDSHFHKSLIRKQRRISNRKRNRVLLSLFVLIGILAVAMVWLMFKPVDDSVQSKNAPSIITFSPKKSPGNLPVDEKASEVK